MVLSDPVAQEEIKIGMLCGRKQKLHIQKNIYIHTLYRVTILHYHLELSKIGLHSYRKAVFECNIDLAQQADGGGY